MASKSTLSLVKRAREGDGEARSALIGRFYQDWIDKFHGDLGTSIRKMYDTGDLVQSAVADALRDLPKLKNEGLFFAWVTSIIRHKIALHHRRLRKEVALKESTNVAFQEPVTCQDHAQDSLERDEIYLQTLDDILALFPEHPEEMAAMVLSVIDERSIGFIMEFLDLSERTVFRRIRDGVGLLKRRIGP